MKDMPKESECRKSNLERVPWPVRSGLLPVWLFLTALYLPSASEAQTYFLKENFSGASGTVPPTGWQCIRLSGGPAPGFRFDNPRSVQTALPLQAPFALFDAVSSPLLGSSQSVVLESPSMDLTGTTRLLLSYDHQFVQGSESVGRLQARVGGVWTDVAVYNASTNAGQTEVHDMTALLAGRTGVAIRFLWSGKADGIWAIDNVKLYAPLPLDAGISSIDVPRSPFGEGLTDVKVTLTNYGSEMLNAARIRWSVNGVMRGDTTWSGSLPFASRQANLPIGRIDLRAGVNYVFKVWSEDPNALDDENPSNDTIVRSLIPSMCGTYTIGGTNPNFPTVTRAVEFLHSAGIGCPVVFKIRDGVYNEQLELKVVRGASPTNTITFESESGDSSKVLLTSAANVTSFPYTMNLNGARHVRFRKMGFSKLGPGGYHAMALSGRSFDIRFDNCRFVETGNGTSNIFVLDETDSVVVSRSDFIGEAYYAVYMSTTGSVRITDNRFRNWYAFTVLGNVGRLLVERNLFERSEIAIWVDVADTGYIARNEIRFANRGVGLFGVGRAHLDRNMVNFNRYSGIRVEANRALVTNNRVWNAANRELSSENGIEVSRASGARILFNTVRMVTGSPQSTGITIHGVDSLELGGNIFSMSQDGVPAWIASRPRALKADRNIYHSARRLVGRIGTTSYRTMQSWRQAIPGEQAGISGNPWFLNDSSFIPNLIYLNGSGTPWTGVRRDFDDTSRSAAMPDIGASEFDPCPRDAAIEALAEPASPLDTIVGPVRISLLNNGSLPMTSVRVAWSVNGSVPRDTTWTGSLASGQSTVFQVGTHDFRRPGGYVVKAWLVHASPDCSTVNDTLVSDRLYPRLCGTYTIGGNAPDFRTINEAVAQLTDAGISCPVTFRLRDGVYQEQVRIGTIPGASPLNTVTFESEGGDSSRVTIVTSNSLNALRYTVSLYDASYVRFRRIGFEMQGPTDYYALKIEGASRDVEVFRCHFPTSVQNASNLIVLNQCDSIRILESSFTGSGQACISFDLTGRLQVLDNRILGSHEYGIIGYAPKMTIARNRMEGCNHGIYAHSSDSARIIANRIDNAVRGIRITGAARFEVDANRVNFRMYYGIMSDAPYPSVTNNWVYNTVDRETTSLNGIEIRSAYRGRVLFNTVHMSRGLKQSSALWVSSGDSLVVTGNILSMGDYGYPVYVDYRPRGFSLDRNGYQSKYGWVGWIDNRHITQIAEWRTQVAGEANGMVANPFFLNDSTLVPSQILLNGSGPVGTGIDSDIDGASRPPSSPDIGAKEFSPCQNDVGIASILEPNSPLDVGVRRIRIQLQNNGLSTLSQVRISWAINGSAVRDTLWQGSLTSAQSTLVDIGTFDFKPLTEYVIRVWTSLSGTVADCNTTNDTLRSNRLYARLCGTLTIGGSNPDFRGFQEAAAFLEAAGISCPVVFKVRDGTYDEQVQIDSVMGASPVNTITFESQSGDSTKVVLTKSGYSVTNRYTLNLNGTRYIRFRKMGFSRQGNGEYTSVLVSGNSKDIRFQNCHFVDNPESAQGISITEKSDSIFVQGSTFLGNCYRCVGMGNQGSVHITDNRFGQTQWLTIDGETKQVEILRNRFASTPIAIRLRVSDTASILANTIVDAAEGIWLTGTARYRVSGNRVGFTTGTGITATGIQNSVFSNNWLYNQQPLSTNGMMFEACEDTRILFNTLNITGTNNNSSSLAIKDGRNLKVFNNILRNASGGYCMKIVNGSPNLLSDYNCYYAPLNNIGSIDDRIYNYLSQWGTVIGGETHSLFINPFFRPGDYRPNHILLNDAGIRYDPVTQDIDSSARHPVSPDIGVKEFTPCALDAGINELSSPTLPISTSRQDIRVVLQNQGLSTLTQVRIQWSINGAVQPAFTWNGSLATRRNTEVTIGAFDFLSGPEWTVKAWTSSPNGSADCNTYNDTAVLFVAGTPNSVPFPPVAKDTSVCKGNVAVLRATGAGTIGWYTAATGGTYLGGGPTFTTPPLTAGAIYYVQDSVLTASLARTAVRVTVFDPPPFNPFPDLLYSRADSVVLQVDSTVSPASIVWSNGQTANRIIVEYTGGYRVNVVTRSGCRLTDSVFVQFPDTAGLKVAVRTASCTVPVEVPVQVYHFRRMSQLQGSIRWDTARLRFDSLRLEAALPGLKPEDFDLTQTSVGRLSFRWTSRAVPGRSLPDSTTIFHIRLLPHTGQLDRYTVATSDTALPIRFRDDRDTLMRHARIDGAVQVNTCNLMLKGLVHTPTDDGVQNVEMWVSGTGTRNTLTDRNGLYSLVVPKGDYTLRPYKNNEKLRLNGISTMDLAHIQAHLLFRERLNNPYKVIAADVDSTGSVTTGDIMFLRRMLLGLDTSLPGNRTWAFVDAEQTFPNANNPFPFRSSKLLPGAFGPVTQRFRAVKLGDVNYDRNPKLDQGPSPDSLLLYTEAVEEPGLLRIRIRAHAVERLMGFQGTLEWDAGSLRLLRVQGGGLGVSFGRIAAQEGRIPFSWNDPRALGVGLSEGLPVMELEFERNGLGGGNLLRLADSALAREAFDASYQRMHMDLRKAGIPSLEASSGIRIIPNPVNGFLTAEWVGADREWVWVRVVDARGRLLTRMRTEQRVGLNRLRLDLGNIAYSGLCLLGIEDAKEVRWTRFLRAR